MTVLPGALLAAATALWGLAAQAQERRPVEDTMAQRMEACTVCHGPQGRSTAQGYFPRIAGKPAGYLANQLINFRDGRRHNGAMAYLVKHMSDDYVHEIGRYFGGLDLPYPPPQAVTLEPASLERARTLVFKGDGARGLPACVHCHGERMTGALPAFPGLLGLPRDYLVAQLGAWRTGQRHAVAPDCMRTVAQRLTPEDITAVASWLAAQPMPSDSKPAAASSLPLPLPMPCGSGPR